MSLEYSDIKRAVSALSPAQALEVAAIAQLASADMLANGKTYDGQAVGGGGGYSPPAGGIPRTDLAVAVQTSLTAADNALPATARGAANGVASLVNGTVPANQLPALASNPFVYNAGLQVALATVDGQEVVALPHRGGGAVGAIVGHRRGTLADLITLAGTPGEISIPDDYPGYVRHTGVAGEAHYSGDGVYVIFLNSAVVDSQAFLSIPTGVRRIKLELTGALHPSIITAGAIDMQWSGVNPNRYPFAVAATKFEVAVSDATRTALTNAGVIVIVGNDGLIDYSNPAFAGKNHFEYCKDSGGFTLMTTAFAG